MNALSQADDTRTSQRVRQVLLDLARREDDLAADAAAALPYWQACPPSVVGHRAAASALRWEADQFRDAG